MRWWSPTTVTRSMGWNHMLDRRIGGSKLFIQPKRWLLAQSGYLLEAAFLARTSPYPASQFWTGCQKVFGPAPHSTALVQTPVQLLLPFTVWASLRCSHPTVYRLPWGNRQKYSKRAWITPFGFWINQMACLEPLSCCCESFVDVFWDKKHLPMNCTHSRHSKNWPKRLPWSCPTADRFPMTSIPTVGDTGVSRMNIRIQQTTSNRTYLCIKGPI